MRLRNLRKLEEMEIKAEDRNLRTERKSCRTWSSPEKDKVEDDCGGNQGVRKIIRPEDAARQRRASFSQAPVGTRRGGDRGGHGDCEPITVVVSQKGWIRALKGTVNRPPLPSRATTACASRSAETTSKRPILRPTAVYTLGGRKLPGDAVAVSRYGCSST